MRVSALLAALLLIATAVPGFIPTAVANPGNGYCPGVVIPSGETPTVTGAETCETTTGRVFPEAIARAEYAQSGSTGYATDYVSYFEFQSGLTYLAANYPDYVTVHETGQSYGLCNAAALPGMECTKDHFPVYMLEITNKNSPMPLENRQSLLFMLSIHGVEKGGREGGFRVLEDLLKGIGMGGEPIQNGAGLPEPLARLDGEGQVETYQHYLDFQRVFLLMPNPDGWAHDEAPYTATSSPSCGAPPNGISYCRTNGNGTDLNRQAPTMGWQNPNRHVTGEPESIGYYNWMLEQEINWAYAIDIHGMINHQNFIAIMLPAASMTPQEMQRSIRLSETLKERLNGNPHFSEWQTAFETAEDSDDQSEPACEQSPDPDQCPIQGSSGAAGSSTFAEYYTVIDAIGYTDSGFNGDYFAQDTGLNAPGYDIEMAYNHLNCDSQYNPCAQFNDYHVKSVREIVKSFMDAAALDVRISFETAGQRTLYVESSFVATNADDKSPTPGGWADQNPGDDRWDYGTDQVFAARPAKYWEDMRPYVRSGDEIGVLTKSAGSEVNSELLSTYNTVVIPGSAIDDLAPDAITAIANWTRNGGTLVLTDQALKFLDMAGITKGAVDVAYQYMGGIKVDLTHPLLAKVRGGVMQMYEPTPLGFEVGANAAPNWFVDADQVTKLEGTIAGRMCGSTQLNNPGCDANGAGLGEIPVGSGKIRFMGSLLANPTEEFYHPYGLDHYATTYSGNQILRNLLGWEEVFAAPPIVITDSGEIIETPNEAVVDPSALSSSDAAEDTPGFAVVIAFVVLACLALARRRL